MRGKRVSYEEDRTSYEVEGYLMRGRVHLMRGGASYEGEEYLMRGRGIL